MGDVFIIVQVGVHRHDIGGVFTTLDDAKAGALERIQQEPDGYHSWEVLRFPLDETVEDGDLVNRLMGGSAEWEDPNA